MAVILLALVLDGPENPVTVHPPVAAARPCTAPRGTAVTAQLPLDSGSSWVDAHAAGSGAVWERDRLVAGRYRLLRPLGSGGSAQVWAARDESLGREVAIKSLSGLSTQGGHERERLEREARLLAALHHPLITTVFDLAEAFGPDGTGHPVLVTELLDGESLGARLKRAPLASPDALAVCAQVADALATAHGSGVVHRDVKPGNVMLTSRGAVLLDFGISRRETDADLTGQVVIGTPACMAPEQWRGCAARPASDVYALGCLLYWCLSGHAPYAQRELPALGMSHLLSDPPDLPLTDRHSAEIDAVYRACMRKDADERPSAREVADALKVYARSASAPPAPRARNDGNPTLAIRRSRRRTRLAAYFAATGAALAAVIVLPLAQPDAAPATPASNGGSASSARPTPSASTTPGRTSATANPRPSTVRAADNTTHDPSATRASPTPAGPHGGGGGHRPGHGKHGGS